MTERYSEGENFTIDIVDDRAECIVWSRPDTDSATGARFAQKKIGIFQKLARESVQCLLFDLRKAPRVTGPKTQEAIAEMLAPWKRAKKPVAILVGASHLQTLQMQRLLGATPDHLCGVFQSRENALSWLWQPTGTAPQDD